MVEGVLIQLRLTYKTQRTGTPFDVCLKYFFFPPAGEIWMSTTTIGIFLLLADGLYLSCDLESLKIFNWKMRIL